MMDPSSMSDMSRGFQKRLDAVAFPDGIYLAAMKSLAIPISGRSVSAFFESAKSFW